MGAGTPPATPPHRGQSEPPEPEDDPGLLAGAVDGPRFGRAVRALRQLRGLRLKALSAQSGVSIGAISMLERGQFHTVSPRVAGGLAGALGFPDAHALLRYAYGPQERLAEQRERPGTRLVWNAVAQHNAPVPLEYDAPPPIPGAAGFAAPEPTPPRAASRPYPVYLPDTLPTALRAERAGDRHPDLWEYPPLLYMSLLGGSAFGLEAPDELPRYGVRRMDRLWVRTLRTISEGALVVIWHRGGSAGADRIAVEPYDPARHGTTDGAGDGPVVLGTVVLIEPRAFVPRQQAPPA